VLDQDPTNYALFLDLDGTIIDIAATPDGVSVPPELVPLLARLYSGLRGALGIITGRSVADTNRLLVPLKLIVAGVHGAELCTVPNGEVRLAAGPLDPLVIDAVHKLSNIAAGVVVEPKVYSIAVHYRMAPTAGPQIEAALRRILEDSPDHLILSPGRRVIEVVPKHVSKGAALEALLSLAAFRGRRPIMVGDDVPDESAFTAAVRHGGVGLRVEGEHFRGEAADFEGPAHVRTWLAATAERLETKKDGSRSVYSS
jgi:trehalose 6-phosphate phosphatase